MNDLVMLPGKEIVFSLLSAFQSIPSFNVCLDSVLDLASNNLSEHLSL